MGLTNNVYYTFREWTEAGANGTLGLNVLQAVTSELARLNVGVIILNPQMEVTFVEEKARGLSIENYITGNVTDPKN